MTERRAATGRRAGLTGHAAEEIAARLYAAEGAEVLATRWRCPEGEIDLIVKLPDVIVFVEVKARRARDDAAGAISARQWRRLGAAANRYLAELGDTPTDCRFDVVLVDGAGQPERLENAYAFDEW